MTSETIVLIGGGGHCKSAIDVIESGGRFRIAGIVDVPERLGEKVLGYEIIADESSLERLVREYGNFLVTVGQIQDPAPRRRLFEQIQACGGNLPAIASPTARVSPHGRVERGTLIGHQAVINSEARVGANCIINTGAIVEHDAVVEAHVHISTGAIVNGGCRVGEGTFVGSQAVLAHGISVGKGSVLGAGAVLLRDAEAHGVYLGNPARLARKNDRNSS